MLIINLQGGKMKVLKKIGGCLTFALLILSILIFCFSCLLLDNGTIQGYARILLSFVIEVILALVLTFMACRLLID